VPDTAAGLQHVPLAEPVARLVAITALETAAGAAHHPHWVMAAWARSNQDAPSIGIWERSLSLTGNLRRRPGWVTFAGVVGLVAGGYNALSGIAALADDDTVAAQTKDVLFGIDLTLWGWFWLLVGLAQIVAGVLILQRNEWGRWLGIAIAALSAVITVFVIFVFPLWSIAVLTLDCLVLYGLLTESESFDP
jgi:hypothetical protein